MQEKLFYEDEYEALNLMVSHGTKTPQQLAGFLFPHIKPASGYSRLKACLNPEGDQNLTFGQIIAAMKFCECYDPMMFVCDETMHARPDRKAPRDEEIKIVEAMNNAAEVMNRAMRQLDNLRSRNTTCSRA